MVWQRAGTVAVVNGSTTVIGTNVDFAASSRNGDAFVGPDGATYELANVASSSVISILPAYKGPSVSGAAYAIVPVQGYDKMLSDAFNNLNNQFGPKLAALGTTGNYETLPVNKGGTGASNEGDARWSLGLVKVDTNIDTGAGRLLTVGYGGLGAVDNARYAGTAVGPQYFRMGGVITGQFQLDGVVPFLQSGWLVTYAGVSNSTCSQSFYSWDSGNSYFRTMVNGTWRTWQKVYSDANTTRAADGTLKAI